MGEEGVLVHESIFPHLVARVAGELQTSAG